MYASSTDNFDFSIKGVEIYRLVSQDGINFQLSPSSPVFKRSPTPGDWDHGGVETASVVQFRGKYYLFYTAYATLGQHTDSTAFRIGRATSDDGINWVRGTTGPLVAPVGPPGVATPYSFNQWVVAEPGAVVVGDQIQLYFAAQGIDPVRGGLFTIGMIRSSDGSTWSAPQRVLTPIESEYPTPAWAGYSTPAPVYMNGQVHLFFDVASAGPFRQKKIRHAQSPDGLSNWTQDSAPIFSYTDFDWTQEEIRAPSAALDGTTLRLWFAGHTNVIDKYGIGLATCEL
jgi:hypothetical protein